MVRWIAELMESWKLDSGGATSSSGSSFGRVDQLLADRAGHPVHRSPEGLEGRIVAAISAGGVRALPKRSGYPVWRIAAAACLLLAVGVAVRSALFRTSPVAEAGSMAMLKVPVSPQPMLRLVAGSFDQPLRDETARMMNDTRRATRAMTRCVPFTRWGN